jgi:malonate decarboxylase delta subunit
MSGMDRLQFSFSGGTALPAFAPVLVGVVASGNLEVLVEPASGAWLRRHLGGGAARLP